MFNSSISKPSNEVILEIKNLRLESEPLLYIDNCTRGYKNEDDFINHYYARDKIEKFIEENGNNKGKLVISYAKSVNSKEDLQPLYNDKNDFTFTDDPYTGRITDIERARKLLFNSKNQLFAKLVLENNTLDRQLNKMIDLTEEENKYITVFGIRTIFVNNKYYVSFKSLFEYRTLCTKLGCIRNVYQEMLDVLKSRLMYLDDSTFYFYNRQLRIMMNKYDELKNNLTIRNFRVGKLIYLRKYVLKKNNRYYL